jgi:arylsulfatase A-like enzyme
VPCAIGWPGVINPGTVLTDVFAHEDMIPTIIAARVCSKIASSQQVVAMAQIALDTPPHL